MAIVRELLIRLGFQTDKKAINETNRAITGFKTRFAIAATAASYAFKVIKDFFGDIATALLDSDELARSLGISLNELRAMQEVAQKFRIRPEQLAGVFAVLQKDLNEFAQGFGRLPEIARQLGIEISRDTGPKELFDQYIKAIRNIENEQERIRISTALFGDKIGAKISDLSLKYDDFKEAVKQAYDQLENQPDVLPEAKKFEESINNLTTAWNKFAQSISVIVFPVLQYTIEHLTLISDLLRTIFNVDSAGVKNTLNSASKLLDPIFEKTGLNYVSDYFKNTFFGGQSALNGLDENTFSRLTDYIENKPGYQYNGFLAPAGGGSMPNVTNNIDISVPPGSTQDQAEYISSQVQQAVDSSIMNTFYQIQNNNPVVE